jgi:exodeoxyribonuclease-3
MPEPLKLATFNINNVVKRLRPLLQWLDPESPDIVCLQVLKASHADFPVRDLRAAGYGASPRAEVCGPRGV